LASEKPVVSIDSAFFQSGIEPIFALRAGSIGKTLGHHGATAEALSSIVANPGGCVHGFSLITLLQQLLRHLRGMSSNIDEAPHAQSV
jgi:hypothetical protein